MMPIDEPLDQQIHIRPILEEVQAGVTRFEVYSSQMDKHYWLSDEGYVSATELGLFFCCVSLKRKSKQQKTTEKSKRKKRKEKKQKWEVQIEFRIMRFYSAFLSCWSVIFWLPTFSFFLKRGLNYSLFWVLRMELVMVTLNFFNQIFIS